MAHDVYVIGLWDDWLSCYLVDKETWIKLDRDSMQERDFTPFFAWDIFEAILSPEEIEQMREEAGDNPEGSMEDDLTLMQIVKLVQLGIINIIDIAEGLQM